MGRFQTSYEQMRHSSRYVQLMLTHCMPRDFVERLDQMQDQLANDLRGTPDNPSTAPAAVQVVAAAAPRKPSGAFQPTSLVFEAGQPNCLFDHEGGTVYRGQDVAKRRIVLRTDQLTPTSRFKSLLTGPAGTGKTTLARIIAKRIQARHETLGLTPGPYYELLPAQIESKEQLEDFMMAVNQNPTSIVFVDEVHKLTNVESLFHVLHDSGAPRFPMGNGGWLDMHPTISWIAATTDPGEMDSTTGGALRRRLEPELRLEAPSKEILTDILLDLAAGKGLEIEAAAARAVADRSLFPWQIALIFSELFLIALRDAEVRITTHHTDEAFTMMELDEAGLLREDRDIILTLLRSPYRLASQPTVVRYRMGEEALCAAAGVDRITYKRRIQPKLMKLGLLTTMGGQCLTDTAVSQYGHLKQSGSP
jgi:Holliday junction resolvasome RuvABC ATP-dependent DNA helicase subunit